MNHTHIEEGLINTRKIILIQPTYSSSKSLEPGAHSSNSGTRWASPLDRTPFRHRASLTHTHTHSDWDKADTPVHCTCTSLGCGRKPEYLEKTHADMQRKCKVHTDCGPSWELIFLSTLWWKGIEQKDIIWGPAVHRSPVL